jgi:GH24 family phage-related lysozyme (muramidase)
MADRLEQMAMYQSLDTGLDAATVVASAFAAVGVAVLAWAFVTKRRQAASDAIEFESVDVSIDMGDGGDGGSPAAPAPPPGNSPAAPAPPPGNGLILDAVRSTWGTWSQGFEGRTPTMYQDVKGYITAGVGNLMDPITLALPLQWLKPDGSVASHDEIVAEWNRVKAMKPGLFWKDYQSPDALYLSDTTIDALVLRQLDANAVVLQRYFPDFASFPAGAQRAILSIAWAVGAGFPPKWPNFTNAVLAKDWTAAADNSSINSVGNPGVIPRNAADKAALLEAASQEANS